MNTQNQERRKYQQYDDASRRHWIKNQRKEIFRLLLAQFGIMLEKPVNGVITTKNTHASCIHYLSTKSGQGQPLQQFANSHLLGDGPQHHSHNS